MDKSYLELYLEYKDKMSSLTTDNQFYETMEDIIERGKRGKILESNKEDRLNVTSQVTLDLNGNTIKIWNSTKEICQELNFKYNSFDFTSPNTCPFST